MIASQIPITERNRPPEPLCQFGPGGDYSNRWSPNTGEANCLDQLLRAPVIQTLLGIICVFLGLYRIDQPGTNNTTEDSVYEPRLPCISLILKAYPC